MGETRLQGEDNTVIGEDVDVLQILVDNIREVLFVRDPSAGRMLFVNPVFEEIWGIPRETLYENPRVFVDAILPEDRPKVFAALEAQDKHEHPFELEYRIRNNAGEVRHIFARAFLVRRDGRVHRVVGLAWDLTARRKVEDDLRELQKNLEARTAELERLVEEKDLLIKEVNHRVKNNLQLVSSLLQLQIERTNSEDAARSVLTEVRARVRAVAVAHEHLHRKGDASAIELDDYARTITTEVATALGSRGIELSTRFETGELRLPVERAIPFGLLLNELLTNAYRHAFPNDSVGTLRVTLSRGPDEQIVLEVADDGAGAVVDQTRLSQSLGLRLVRALASQLSGVFELDGSAGGLTARVRFPPDVTP